MAKNTPLPLIQDLERTGIHGKAKATNISQYIANN